MVGWLVLAFQPLLLFLFYFAIIFGFFSFPPSFQVYDGRRRHIRPPPQPPPRPPAARNYGRIIKKMSQSPRKEREEKLSVQQGKNSFSRSSSRREREGGRERERDNFTTLSPSSPYHLGWRRRRQPRWWPVKKKGRKKKWLFDCFVTFSPIPPPPPLPETKKTFATW